MEKVIVAGSRIYPKFKSSLIKNSDKVGKKIVSSLRLSGKGKVSKELLSCI